MMSASFNSLLYKGSFLETFNYRFLSNIFRYSIVVKTRILKKTEKALTF